MRLTVLGSNAGAPGRTNPASGYLVEANGAHVWMDAGPGTLMKLAALTDPGTLDAVVISHTHVDHCTDLLGLFAYLAYGPGGVVPIDVHAPVGTRDHLAAFARAGAGHVFDDVLVFHEHHSGASAVVGPFAASFGAAVHPVPALVTRLVHDGTALVYSGDTGPGGDLEDLAERADILVCEASIQGDRSPDTYPHHLTAYEAGAIASAAEVGVLVVTHVPAGLDPAVSVAEARERFDGPVHYASPDTTFTFPDTE